MAIDLNNSAYLYSVYNPESVSRSSAVNPYYSANSSTRVGGATQSGKETDLPGLVGSGSSLVNGSHQSSAAQKYTQALGALKQAGQQLASSANAKSAFSTNTEVASATSSKYATPMKADLAVTQLAKGQVSQSIALTSAQNNAFSTGTNRFTLMAGGQAYAFNVDVVGGQSTKSVLNALAQKINGANLNVRAVVVENKGMATLELSSTQTGEDATFSLTSASGDMLDKLGLSQTTQAQNAQYSVNGREYTSQSNTVSLPGASGVTLQLQGEGEAKIAFGPDRNAMLSAAQNFVDKYNAALDALPSTGGAMKSFRQGLTNLGSKSALSELGLSQDSTGKLTLDKEKLASAIDQSPERVKEAFGSYTGPVQTAMSRLSAAPTVRETAASNNTSGKDDTGSISASSQESELSRLMKNANFLNTIYAGNRTSMLFQSMLFGPGSLIDLLG